MKIPAAGITAWVVFLLSLSLFAFGSCGFPVSDTKISGTPLDFRVDEKSGHELLGTSEPEAPPPDVGLTLPALGPWDVNLQSLEQRSPEQPEQALPRGLFCGWLARELNQPSSAKECVLGANIRTILGQTKRWMP